MPIPVLSNFRPDGMAANVVGGQRLSTTSVSTYDDTRTSAVAPASNEVIPGRLVAYDATGNVDVGSRVREPRLGIAAPTTGFLAANFAGIALKRNTTAIRGAIPTAQTVNDTTTSSGYFGGDLLSRAVLGEWWVEYDSAVVVPARGAAVFVEITGANRGRVSTTAGTALPATAIVFTGRVEQGWNGLYYASVNILTKLY